MSGVLKLVIANRSCFGGSMSGDLKMDLFRLILRLLRMADNENVRRIRLCWSIGIPHQGEKDQNGECLHT